MNIYLCSPEQLFTCGGCNEEFKTVAKMASHLKSGKKRCLNPPCANETDKSGRTIITAGNITYYHKITKLGCARCETWSRRGIAINSLTTHYMNYCGEAEPERRAMVRSRDKKYYIKRYGNRVKKVESEESVTEDDGSNEESVTEHTEHTEDDESTSTLETATATATAKTSGDGKIYCQTCKRKIHNEQYFLLSVGICRNCIKGIDANAIGEKYDEKPYNGKAPIARRHVNVLFEESGGYIWYKGKRQPQIKNLSPWA